MDVFIARMDLMVTSDIVGEWLLKRRRLIITAGCWEKERTLRREDTVKTHK